MRDLNQDASAVARLRVAAAGAAVREIDQNLNALFDDLVAPLAAQAGYKTDSASIVLVRWIIKTLRRRQTVNRLPNGQRGIS
jgi:hypothetical protein